MADEPTPVLMGNRSVQAWDAQGNPVSGSQAAQIGLQGLNQGAGQTTPGSNGVVRDTLKEWFDTGRDAVTNVVGKAGQYSPIDVAQMGVSKATGGTVPMPTPMVSDEKAAKFSKMVVPQTPAAAITMAAAGPLAGKIGALAATPIMAGAGALANAATGENPAMGAVTGAGGTALPAAVSGLANKVAAAGQKVVTKSGIRDIAVTYADKVLNGLKEDVPALYNAIKGAAGSAPAKLLQMHDPEVWKDSMGGLMRKAESPIIKVIPEIPAPVQPPPVPFVYPGATAEQAEKLAALGIRAPGAPSGPPKIVMMKTATAFSQLKTLKADARAAYDPTNPAQSKALRDSADQWQDKIMEAVESHDPTLADNWQTAMGQYNRGLLYTTLSKSAVKTASPTAGGTPFDETALIRHYLSSPGRYAPSKLPGLNRNLFPGEVGAGPEIADPSLYARAFLPMGAKFNIPTPKFATVPGEQYGAPDAARILGDAARAGVFNLTSTGQR
jgi:hypothetical protein